MRCLTFLVATALVACVAAADAKEKTKGPPLTRDQLKRCVVLDEEQERHRTRYNLQVREANELVKQQAQMRADIDQMKLAIDSGETFRMDAYNGKIEEHNAIGTKHDEYQLRMAEISEEQRVVIEEFNHSCAGRPFRNADFVEAKRRKK